MRRKVGIAVGVCAALVLAGTAGVVAWTQANDDNGRPVGTWHQAPGVAPAPVAMPEGPPTERTESAAVVASQGRRKIGEQLPINKLLGYANAPRRETFSYPGASYVKLHFSRMEMRPGDYLTVSDPQGRESYRYDAPAPHEPAAVGRWAMSITGDTAVLETHRGPAGTAGSPLGGMGVQVDRVARGFSRAEQGKVPEESLAAPGRTGREESVCGGDQSTDAVCYRSADPVAYTRTKAIARLLIDGTELCTGWRIGSKNRMVTNNHCFDNSKAARDTEVWFNYQCATCGGSDVLKPTKVTGERVLATDRTYDFTLFTVGKFAQVRKYGHLSLDTARPARGQELYVPQHPAGGPARIVGALGGRAGTCEVGDNAYAGYSKNSDISYLCDTAGGSSGSPVLSRKTNKVVALHHFGGCPNSGVRADLLSAKLKSLL
jgi:hypothetical protein